MRNSIKAKTVGAFYIFYIFAFALVLFNTIFNNFYFDYKWYIILPIAALWFCLFFLIYKLLRKFEEAIERNLLKCTVAFFVLLTLTQITVYYFAAGYPTVDFERVFTGAYNYTVAGEILDPYLDYFYKFPTNMPVTILLQFIFRTFNMLGYRNFFIVGAVFNGVCIQLAYLFAFLIVKELSCAVNAFMAVIVLYFCLPLQTYISIFYTDTTTMLYPLAAIYFSILLAKKQNSKLKTVLIIVVMGAVIAFGTLIKSSAVFGFIAVLVVLLLNFQLKKLLACAASFLVFFTIFSAIYDDFMYKNILDESIAYDAETPYVAYIAMALGGDGTHNAADNYYTWSFDTKEEKIAGSVDLIKQRLEEKGFFGYLSFLNKKAVRSFGSGNLNAQYIVSNALMKENFAVDIIYPYGKYYNIYDNITQGYHVLIMIFLVVGAVLTAKKRDCKFLTIHINAFGLLLFLLLWEAGTRYLLNHYPILILSGVICVLSHLKHISLDSKMDITGPS